MKCDGCGLQATHREVVRYAGPLPCFGNDPDVTYAYWCEDCAPDRAEEWQDPDDDGHYEDRYDSGPSLMDQYREASDMKRWDRHPSW